MFALSTREATAGFERYVLHAAAAVQVLLSLLAARFACKVAVLLQTRQSRSFRIGAVLTNLLRNNEVDLAYDFRYLLYLFFSLGREARKRRIFSPVEVCKLLCSLFSRVWQKQENSHGLILQSPFTHTHLRRLLLLLQVFP